VGWILRLVKTGAEGEDPGTDLMEIRRPNGLGDIADRGLTLSDAKVLLASVQREIATAQATDHGVRRRDCPRCDGVCRVKDYRDRAVATLFGQITMKLPRFRRRIWNGKAKNAPKSIVRIRAVMRHFRGEPGSRKSMAPSRKLWHHLESCGPPCRHWMVI
jgi:hypothetical protein